MTLAAALDVLSVFVFLSVCTRKEPKSYTTFSFVCYNAVDLSSMLQEVVQYFGQLTRNMTNYFIFLHHGDSVNIVIVVFFWDASQLLVQNWCPHVFVKMVSSHDAVHHYLLHHLAPVRYHPTCVKKIVPAPNSIRPQIVSALVQWLKLILSAGTIRGNTVDPVEPVVVW